MAPRLAAPFRVFVLSPADSTGRRAQMLQRPGSPSDLAQRLQTSDGAPLGDVFSFVSSLYFRGKLAYARAFERPPAGICGIHVITPCDGLRPPEAPFLAADFERYARVPIDVDEPRYREPLLRDARALSVPRDTEIVLLGSVASGKYVELLAPLFGERLVFPADFVGRGDMSRGGLLLRCVAERRELAYRPVLGGPRHGVRPARLEPLRRGRAQP
jgi:hypothetical protein